MDRFDVIRSWLDKEGLGLEIGPLHAPIAAKRDGWRVETLDHATTKTLRERYRDSPDVDATLIEDVDHVSDGRPMPEVIGTAGRFDWIIASHVAEHVPDLLAFFSECEILLKPAGRLILALPDKRQCFDALRPPSTTGQVLQAHFELRKRHPPGHGYDYLAKAVELGGRYAWHPEQTGQLHIQYELEAAYSLYRALVASSDYHDLHGWVFVPQSLRLIVEELHQVGLIGLREEILHETMGVEFFAVLSRNGSGAGRPRTEMILDSARAERDGLTTLLGHGTAVDAQFEAMRLEVASATANRDEVINALAAAQKAASRLQEEIAEARAETRQAQSAIAAVHASTSWRMTMPLRKGIQMLKRMHHD